MTSNPDSTVIKEMQTKTAWRNDCLTLNTFSIKKERESSPLEAAGTYANRSNLWDL
jgi:hypothetical protein